MCDFIGAFSNLTSLEWVFKPEEVDYDRLRTVINPNLIYLRLSVLEGFPMSYCPNVEEIHSHAHTGIIKAIYGPITKYPLSLRSLIISRIMEEDDSYEIVYQRKRDSDDVISKDDDEINDASNDSLEGKIEMDEWSEALFMNNPELITVTLTSSRVEFGEFNYMGG